MSIRKIIPLSVKRYILKQIQNKEDSNNHKIIMPQVVEISEEQIETNRLFALKRFQPTSTKFLDRYLEIVDGCTYLNGNHEIWVKEIYDFKADNEQPYIIDCGANIGLSVLYFKYKYPDARVMAFEPDEQICNTLKKNVRTYDLSHVEVHQEAIWKADGEITFQQEGGFSGRIPINEEEGNIVRVKARRLKDLLNKPVDFLKIDIEGAEYEVLKDCSDTLQNVKNIFIEYHSHITQKQTLNEILTILTNSGFRYHIHEAYTQQKPFVQRELMLGMDLQLDIFGYRI